MKGKNVSMVIPAQYKELFLKLMQEEHRSFSYLVCYIVMRQYLENKFPNIEIQPPKY